MFKGPAIALLELESIARGYVVADALVKKAPVRLLMTEPVSPGKFLILIDGEVADVEESFREGLEIAGPGLIDKLLLPAAAEQLSPAIRGEAQHAAMDSLGVVETNSVAACLLAADAAVKAAEVKLIRMHLARGIGGKGYFTLTGSLDMVDAAVAAGAAAIAPELLVTTEVIAAPHGDLAQREVPPPPPPPPPPPAQPRPPVPPPAPEPTKKPRAASRVAKVLAKGRRKARK